MMDWWELEFRLMKKRFVSISFQIFSFSFSNVLLILQYTSGNKSYPSKKEIVSMCSLYTHLESLWAHSAEEN